MENNIQKIYLEKKVIEQMKMFFLEQSFIQLHSFFEIDVKKYISLSISRASHK